MKTKVPELDMMKPNRVRDLSGSRFGRLAITAFAGLTHARQARWVCKCDCGSEITTTSRHLLVGDTKSCGCLPKERRIAPIKKANEIFEVSGIYCIKSLIDERCYVGSAVNLRSRCRLHEFDLRHQKHANRHLQNFYQKHGADGLQFSVIEICSAPDLILREQHFINAMRPAFNICAVAGNTLGRKHTDATRKLISEKKKGTVRNVGFKHSAETRAKQSAARKGKRLGIKRAPFTTEHRCAIARARVERGLSTGSRNHFAVLTEQTVAAIKLDISHGMRGRDLCEKYGVSKACASHIRVGRTWSHVPMPLGETKTRKKSERFTERAGVAT